MVGRNRPCDIHRRAASERFRRFGDDARVARDQVNLDILQRLDAGADGPDGVPPPDEVVAEIVEDMEAALDEFRFTAAQPAAQAVIRMAEHRKIKYTCKFHARHLPLMGGK